MILRHLEERDAEPMLEWMHDSSVVEKLQTDFTSKTLMDCERFIMESNLPEATSLHLAICDDADQYIGTVSLKHIQPSSAEFGITIGRTGMGTGIAINAMRLILDKAFVEYGLKYVYWCVAPDNIRALRFYDKNGFNRVSSEEIDSELNYSKDQIARYIWYMERKVR